MLIEGRRDAYGGCPYRAKMGALKDGSPTEQKRILKAVFFSTAFLLNTAKKQLTSNIK